MDWDRMSRAQRDAAYNNSAGVPDSAALIAARNDASAAIRRQHPEKLDLPYGAGERCRFDLFPAARPQAPCLVFIHGGYWMMNRREDFAGILPGFAAHGWSVALPGYTLAPAASLTQIVGEIRASLDWLAARGAVHGIAGPLVLAGWSAGAHLAALCLDHPAVGAGLAISGLYELAPLRDIYLDETLHLTDTEVVELSPMRRPVVRKPMHVAYGTQELPPFVEESRAFHALRSAAHAPGALLPVAGANHYTILEQLRDPRSDLLRLALGLAA